MSGRKRNGPRAVAAARKAKNVACGKPTLIKYPKAPFDASAFARAWVARRCRVESRWAAVIVEAAGLGGRA